MKRWILQPEVAAADIAPLEQGSDLLARLLHRRGVRSGAEARAFLEPSYGQLHDPYRFRQMPEAVERLWRAVLSGERVCIFGDYDADAVSAAAVLVRALRYLGLAATTYIPDRFGEGYGLNIPAAEQIAAGGATLIVTVDCGTNSREVAARLKDLAVDLIVTDHHEQVGELPACTALLNPKVPGETYPNDQLTGSGVAYKLAQALLSDAERVAERRATFGETHTPGYEKWLIDLASIGTVADCHELTGENRSIVRFGLAVMKKTRWVGLRALLQRAGSDPAERPPDAYTIGFVVAPRLNAAGRLEHADKALDLLLTDDPATAAELASGLESVNDRRRELTARVLSEARERAAQLAGRRILMVMGEGWPRGVVGLVAGKLADEYKKPVVVFERGEAESVGSARSVGSFNVVEALSFAASHLTRFGGHKQAAGLTLLTDRFEQFYAEVLVYAETKSHELEEEPGLELEAVLAPGDITAAVAGELARLEPHGAGNPRPLFLLPLARVASIRPVGSQQQHLQVMLDFGGASVSAIHFSVPQYLRPLYEPGALLDFACELTLDSWQGSLKPKLKINDVREARAI